MLQNCQILGLARPSAKSVLRVVLSGLMMCWPWLRLQVVSEQEINHLKTGLSQCQKSGSSNRAGKNFEEFYCGYAK